MATTEALPTLLLPTATAAATPLPTRIASVQLPTPDAVPELPRVTLARRLAAERLGIGDQDHASLVVESFEATMWPNSGLGCEQEGYAYATVVLPGFVVTCRHGAETLVVHVDAAGAPGIIPGNCLDRSVAAPPAEETLPLVEAWELALDF